MNDASSQHEPPLSSTPQGSPYATSQEPAPMANQVTPQAKGGVGKIVAGILGAAVAIPVLGGLAIFAFATLGNDSDGGGDGPDTVATASAAPSESPEKTEPASDAGALMIRLKRRKLRNPRKRRRRRPLPPPQGAGMHRRRRRTLLPRNRKRQG